MSYKHTPEQKEKADKKFKTRFQGRSDGFDRCPRQYIAEYEGEEDDDEYDEYDEGFDLRFMEGEDQEAFMASITNMLTDQALNNSLTLSVPHTIEPTDPFSYKASA